MPKFMFKASYTQDGVKGLIAEGGTSRRAAIETMAEGLGGSIEAFYYAHGDDDAIVIADLPDAATATAVSLAVSAGGAATVSTVALITPEEVDEAAKITVNYRPAGS